MKYKIIKEIALKSEDNTKTKVFKAGSEVEAINGLIEVEETNYILSGIEESSIKQVKKNDEKNKGGRPSKFLPEHPQMLIDFIKEHPKTEKVLIKKITKSNGTTEEEYKIFGGDLPFLTDFADKIGINENTVSAWANANKEDKNKYPGFSRAYNTFKKLQKQYLIANGLKGLYNPAFAIFTAKNIAGMTDKNETDINLNGNINLTGLFDQAKETKQPRKESSGKKLSRKK